jgi:hypothetical protein
MSGQSREEKFLEILRRNLKRRDPSMWADLEEGHIVIRRVDGTPVLRAKLDTTSKK